LFPLTAASLYAADISPPDDDHVISLTEENHSAAEVAEALYLSSLASRGLSFSRSFAATHPPASPTTSRCSAALRMAYGTTGATFWLRPTLPPLLPLLGFRLWVIAKISPAPAFAVSVRGVMYASTPRGPVS